METGNWKLETSSKKSVFNFEDLEAWQKAIDLAVEVYTVTKTFPKDELYALTNQLRRACSSVPANIAEGYGRYSLKEKIQFYKIANGSLLEAKSFCYLAERLGYLSKEKQQELLSLFEINQKLLNGLIRSLKEKYGV